MAIDFNILLNSSAKGVITGGATAFENFIGGIKLIAQAFTWMAYLPIRLFGFEPSALLANIIYLAIIFFVLRRVVFRGKGFFWPIIVTAVLIFIGAIGLNI